MTYKNLKQIIDIIDFQKFIKAYKNIVWHIYHSISMYFPTKFLVH